MGCGAAGFVAFVLVVAPPDVAGVFAGGVPGFASEPSAALGAPDASCEGMVGAEARVLAPSGLCIAPDQYDADYESLETKYRRVDGKRAQLAASIKDRENCSRQAHGIHKYLQTRPPLEYTPEAWNTLVAGVDIDQEGRVTVRFKDVIAI